MLLHELFAKLHNANITQPTFLSISIGYRCVAESTSKLPSSVIKPSDCNNLRILLRQTLLLVGSHAALSPRLEQSSSFARTADSFTSYRAMHFSAKRGIAIACRLSVCLSVRLSVCDVGEL